MMPVARKEGEREGAARVSRLAAVLLALAAAFFLVRGCAWMPWNRGGTELRARVTVTRSFGRVVLRDRTVELRRGSDAMRALQEAAEVRTAYGGGFIEAVDGLESAYGKGPGGTGEKLDWFFYVNGQMADVGAAAYQVRDGDWLVFDYHRWDLSPFTPALAGCFPPSFLNGYGGPPRGVGVLYAAGWEEEARELARALEDAGAGPCVPAEIGEGWIPSPGCYEAVLGEWAQLERIPPLAGSFRQAEEAGMFAFFRGGELLLLDERGGERARYAHAAGLVTCTGPRLGEGAVLLLSGTDREGVQSALRLFLEGAQSPEPYLALAVAGGERLGVPAEVP